MKINDKNEWLDLVFEYDVTGTAAFEDMDLTDRQREAVACAQRDLRQAESVNGDKDSDEFCEAAEDAALSWMKDFNDNVK